MTRRISSSLLIVLIVTAIASGQGSNSIFSALGVDRAATDPGIAGAGPHLATTYTDSPITANVRGFPASPVIVIHGAVSAGSFTGFGLSVDIAPVNGWLSNVLVDGFSNPGPASLTDAVGTLSLTQQLASCMPTMTGVVCPLPSVMNVGIQAVTTDPTGPLGLGTSAVTDLTILNGHVEYMFPNDGAAIYTFLDGFTFDFYGTTYTQMWVSSNGFVSFTSPPLVANTTASEVRLGPPRVMGLYENLDPSDPTYGGRVYARQIIEGGMRKVRVVFDHVAESFNQTGPHGFDLTLSENGDIRIYVHNYNAFPGINAAVGITPGGNIDVTSPSLYGHDLSVYYNTALAQGFPVGGLGPDEAIFELYDHSSPTPMNNMDLAGLGFPDGFALYLDPGVPAGNEYLVGP